MSMGRFYFKPYWGLTGFTIIALALLIGLGTWQYHRLQWKTQLLAEVETAAAAPPFMRLSQITASLDAGEPIDFRRISVEVSVPAFDQPFMVFTPENRTITWRLFRPVKADGITVFADMARITDGDKDTTINLPAEMRRITGYVRLARGAVRGETRSTPKANRWFRFNPLPDTHNWADKVSGGADMRFYIDTIPSVSAADSLPVRRPNIRNNHFDYMLTWYGLAICLFVVYILLHRNNGRLGRGV